MPHNGKLTDLCSKLCYLQSGGRFSLHYKIQFEQSNQNGFVLVWPNAANMLFVMSFIIK